MAHEIATNRSRGNWHLCNDFIASSVQFVGGFSDFFLLNSSIVLVLVHVKKRLKLPNIQLVSHENFIGGSFVNVVFVDNLHDVLQTCCFDVRW